MKDRLINFIAFQSVWLISIFGAAKDLAWPAFAAFGVFATVHCIVANRPKPDFMLAGIAVAAGLVIDTVIIQAGVLQYNAAVPFPDLAPIWILVLWANLALAINNSLDWLHGRWVLAAVLGAVAGPLTYIAGAALGAASIGVNQTAFVLTFALTWAAATPAFFLVATALNRRY